MLTGSQRQSQNQNEVKQIQLYNSWRVDADVGLLCIFINFFLNPTKTSFDFKSADNLMERVFQRVRVQTSRNGDVYVCLLRIYWIQQALAQYKFVFMKSEAAMMLGPLKDKLFTELRLLPYAMAYYRSYCLMTVPNCGYFWTLFTHDPEEDSWVIWDRIDTMVREDVNRFKTLYVTAHLKSRGIVPSNWGSFNLPDFQKESVFGEMQRQVPFLTQIY